MFTSLRLERFKNFKDTELKLGPFTVLIGANASGKSNIRDGFRFLHGVARGYSLADIIGEKHGEGGERIWSGIRGGAREIAYSGERSFSLTCQTMISAEMAQQIAWPHRIGENSLDRDIGEESLIYEVDVEVKPRASTSRIIAESLELARGYNVFVSKFTNLYNHSVTLYPDSKQFAVGPYILPRTMPFLGQLPMEVRNWPTLIAKHVGIGRKDGPELNSPAAPRAPKNRRKPLLHREIKNPAPTEGAGHSQGERRLLMICQRGPSLARKARDHSLSTSVCLRSNIISSRKARGVPNDGDATHDL